MAEMNAKRNRNRVPRAQPNFETDMGKTRIPDPKIPLIKLYTEELTLAVLISPSSVPRVLLSISVSFRDIFSSILMTNSQ